MAEGGVEEEGPNAQQEAYWNEVAGPKWVQLSQAINSQIEPIGRAAMERAGVEAGQRVLDVVIRAFCVEEHRRFIELGLDFAYDSPAPLVFGIAVAIPPLFLVHRVRVPRRPFL